MSYPDHHFLYQEKAFVVKANLKAKLDYGDQEYQSQEACYQWIKSYRAAIDIGARYGGWSRQMESRFQKLYAFEPRARWNFVYPINIKMDHVQLFPYGLGNKNETVKMQGNRISQSEFAHEEIIVKTLDQFKLQEIDFIKIDTDGYELKVLEGGRKTILKFKPIICMEVIVGSPYFGEQAEQFILNLGAKRKEQVGQNVIFGW